MSYPEDHSFENNSETNTLEFKENVYQIYLWEISMYM